MTIAVKRACDACHRRKVKCDGVNPCRNCLGSQLSCTYNAIPQKKGPKGSRAKVINELKEKERQTSLSAKVQNRMNGINGAPSSPSLAPTPGLLQSDIVKSCIDFFFAHMYRAMPILDRARLEQQALYMDQTLDTYCLLTSLCAFVLLQPGMTLPNSDPFSLDSMPGGNLVTSTLLVEETVRVRKGYDYMDSPTLNSLCTSYFLYGCHYGLDLQDKAWFHIREATTLIHMIGMNKEQNYLQYDSVEAAKRRRLYWLLFATERAYALKRGRPLSLQTCINLPTSTDDPTDPAPVHFHAFITQINTFRPYDDSLVNIWNKAKDETSPTYLAAMQKQLQNDLPGYLNDTQAQLGELQLNQSWLKDMAWQLSMANPNEGESGLPPYPTPVDIGRDLLPMVSHLPGNLGLPGLRLVEKLFAVASTLTEILAMQPTSRPYITGPRERLHQILNVLTLIRYGHHSYLPLLLSKVQEAVPTLANPMLQNAPEPVLPTCDMDIFDGFGNAGMGQGSCYTASDYDSKYSAPRMDEMSTESESPMAGHSNHDVSSPFSSSAIMSPSVEMPPHGLPANFNTMQDMMSPMGRPPASVFGNPSPINNPQPQQPPISTYPNLNSQGQGMNVNNLNSPPNTNLPPQGHRNHSHGGSLGHGGGLGNGLGRPGGNNGLMSRPQPQRTNSFAMGAPLGGFHHPLQRVNSDMASMGSIGISPLGRDMDFNTLPR